MAEKRRGRQPKKRRETPAQSPGVSLVVQAHGGAIKQGGNPGNKGGPGRPPHALRDTYRALLSTHGQQHLETVFGKATPVRFTCVKCGHEHKSGFELHQLLGERTRLFEILNRYGVGTKDELNVISPEVRMRVQQTVAIISSRSTWNTVELLAELDQVW